MPDHDTPCLFSQDVAHRLTEEARQRLESERDVYQAIKGVEGEMRGMIEKLRDRVPVWVLVVGSSLTAILGWALPKAIEGLIK